MKRIKRSIALLGTICFLADVVLCDGAIGQGADRYRPSNTLAVSSVFDDLAGVEHKDIGDIQLWFAACLKYVASRGLPVTAENLARFDSPDNTIFHPLGMQFFIDKIETLNGGYSSLLVRRYDDTHGFRSYRIVFSSRLESGIPETMEVYTEREYARVAAGARSMRGVPLRVEAKPGDRAAIDRYIRQETGIDALIAWVHDSANAAPLHAPQALGIDYPAMVREIMSRANIVIDTPAGLRPCEQRIVTIVEITPAVEQRLRACAIDESALDGTAGRVIPLYHASNNNLHIFLTPRQIAALKRKGPAAIEVRSAIKDDVAHELGVMAGLPILRFAGVGKPVNRIDDLYRAGKAREASPFSPGAPERFSVADLDANIVSRDFSTGTPASDGRWVLVVDDDPMILKFFATMLEKKGWHVDKASDGDEAIALFDKNSSKYSLVMTDFMMPRVNGETVVRHINTRAPVLMLTGFVGSKAVIDALKDLKSQGLLADYLTKPVSYGALTAAVEKYAKIPVQPGTGGADQAADGTGQSGAAQGGVREGAKDAAPAGDFAREPAPESLPVRVGRIIDATERPDLSGAAADEDIGAKVADARQAGLEILKASFDVKYSLFVDNNLFVDDEYEQDANEGYLSADGLRVSARGRFDLFRIDTSNAERVLAEIARRGIDPNRVVIQVSNAMSEDGARRLSAAGVRVLNVDTRDFRYDTYFRNRADRQKCRFELYAMMLAARKITEEDIRERSSVWRVLRFFIETHMPSGSVTADAYIGELMKKGDAEMIVKCALSYRPMGRWERPEYNMVAATLIAA